MTERSTIAIIFGSAPNFRVDPFKYFILSVNKVQNLFEFRFPNRGFDVKHGPLSTKCLFKAMKDRIDEVSLTQDCVTADYVIGIISTPIIDNIFWEVDSNNAIITTDVWERYFSPPSVFEYILHSIIGAILEMQSGGKIKSHRDTRGCIRDVTIMKRDDRLDIALGYLCDEHRGQITSIFGNDYTTSIECIIDLKWLGGQEKYGTVAHNLKHYFSYNILKDSGFRRTWWERAKESVHAIPMELVKNIIQMVIAILLAFILVQLGLKERPDRVETGAAAWF